MSRRVTRELLTEIYYRVPVEWYGGYADDFDTEAIDADVLDEVNRSLPAGVTLTATGIAFYEEGVDVGLIDWGQIIDAVDVAAIAARHEVTA